MDKGEPFEASLATDDNWVLTNAEAQSREMIWFSQTQYENMEAYCHQQAAQASNGHTAEVKVEVLTNAKALCQEMIWFSQTQFENMEAYFHLQAAKVSGGPTTAQEIRSKPPVPQKGPAPMNYEKDLSKLLSELQVKNSAVKDHMKELQKDRQSAAKRIQRSIEKISNAVKVCVQRFQYQAMEFDEHVRSMQSLTDCLQSTLDAVTDNHEAIVSAKKNGTKSLAHAPSHKYLYKSVDNLMNTWMPWFDEACDLRTAKLEDVSEAIENLKQLQVVENVGKMTRYKAKYSKLQANLQRLEKTLKMDKSLCEQIEKEKESHKACDKVSPQKSLSPGEKIKKSSSISSVKITTRQVKGKDVEEDDVDTQSLSGSLGSECSEILDNDSVSTTSEKERKLGDGSGHKKSKLKNDDNQEMRKSSSSSVSSPDKKIKPASSKSLGKSEVQSKKNEQEDLSRGKVESGSSSFSQSLSFGGNATDDHLEVLEMEIFTGQNFNDSKDSKIYARTQLMNITEKIQFLCLACGVTSRLHELSKETEALLGMVTKENVSDKFPIRFSQLLRAFQHYEEMQSGLGVKSSGSRSNVQRKSTDAVSTASSNQPVSKTNEVNPNKKKSQPAAAASDTSQSPKKKSPAAEAANNASSKTIEKDSASLTTSSDTNESKKKKKKKKKGETVAAVEDTRKSGEAAAVGSCNDESCNNNESVQREENLQKASKQAGIIDISPSQAEAKTSGKKRKKESVGVSPSMMSQACAQPPVEMQAGFSPPSPALSSKVRMAASFNPSSSLDRHEAGISSIVVLGEVNCLVLVDIINSCIKVYSIDKIRKGSARPFIYSVLLENPFYMTAFRSNQVLVSCAGKCMASILVCPQKRAALECLNSLPCRSQYYGLVWLKDDIVACAVYEENKIDLVTIQGGSIEYLRNLKHDCCGPELIALVPSVNHLVYLERVTNTGMYLSCVSSRGSQVFRVYLGGSDTDVWNLACYGDKIVCCNKQANKILLYSINGKKIGQPPMPLGSVKMPFAIAFSQNGFLYLANDAAWEEDKNHYVTTEINCFYFSM